MPTKRLTRYESYQLHAAIIATYDAAHAATGITKKEFVAQYADSQPYWTASTLRHVLSESRFRNHKVNPLDAPLERMRPAPKTREEIAEQKRSILERIFNNPFLKNR